MWFASIVSGAYGRFFNGRVLATDKAEAARKFAALCPTVDLGRVEFIEDPEWKIRSAADIPTEV